MKIFKDQSDIRSWKQFRKRLRANGCHLFDHLDDYPNSILVTGCQRSGTTIVSRIFTQSNGLVNYRFGNDDELDAALILSGQVPHECRGRYCFQTTYMYNCLDEYFLHRNGHQIIWVLRNPYSVICSMLHNWKLSALNELFQGCALDKTSVKERWRYETFGSLGLSNLKKACLSYCAKIDELITLRKSFDNATMVVIEYDDLVQNKKQLLPKLYRFVSLDYQDEYADKLKATSIGKDKRLTSSQRDTISKICEPAYRTGRAQLTDLSGY